MTPDLLSLRDALLPVSRRRTQRAQVKDIVLQDDLDHDGDPILRILVIIAGSRSHLNPVQTLETTRRIRQDLLERNDPRFPVVTYISEADHRRLIDEAA